MKLSIDRTTVIEPTYRVAKVQGQFDIPAEREQHFHLDVDIPLEGKEWNLGAIVGSSGTGKSTIAKELWPDAVFESGHHDWTHPSILDDFPKDMTPAQITSVLTSVGFSSAPVWLRPYGVLSTGQKFRADLARTLTQLDPKGEPLVFDEFTSTVDRTVAKAVCVATHKHVKRTGGKFVAVTCHKDVLPWLQPDWYWDTDSQSFHWGSVQPRPEIRLRIREGSRQAWTLFRGHHYMTGSLSGSCRVFLCYVTLDGEERLAGFFSILPVTGKKGWWRGHRTVVLPDFQGLGIGNRMIETVAEQLWVRERKRFRAVTSAPALVQHRRRHPDMWRLASKPKMVEPTSKTSTIKATTKLKTSAGRLTTSWVYMPEEMRRR